MTQTRCEVCKGRGQFNTLIGDRPCAACDGNGFHEDVDALRWAVQAFIDSAYSSESLAVILENFDEADAPSEVIAIIHDMIAEEANEPDIAPDAHLDDVGD